MSLSQCCVAKSSLEVYLGYFIEGSSVNKSGHDMPIFVNEVRYTSDALQCYQHKLLYLHSIWVS